jgi:7-cyano-7-deazaguanine synthase
MAEKKRAVVLLSGGLDSATVLGIVIADGYDAYALSFKYGQRHGIELESACKVAKKLGASRHLILPIDLTTIGGSALTDNIAVPKNRDERAMGSDIPVTYVPARNTIFLSFALAWAEVLGAEDIFIGVNALDYSGYPDCRPEYIAAFEQMANLATRAAVQGRSKIRIHTPLIKLAKSEIIRTGLRLGIDYAVTHSCYDPTAEGLACGACDSCLIRLKGFAEAGASDPLRYASASLK